MARTVAWFSCGAASAVAAKLALKRDPETVVAYCDTMATEHPDNARFFGDVELWLGVPILRLKSEKYATVDDVIEQRRYMAGVEGAPCTVEMKKVPRFAFERPDDLHVFGLTVDESVRIRTMRESNPGLGLWFALADYGLRKADCLKVVEEAGIALPAMYVLGYRNNNCLGCVKATSAKYWNMVRRDFPEVFAKRVQQSRELGVRLTRHHGERVFLDELPPDYLPAEPLEDISCGPDCNGGVAPPKRVAK